MNTRDELARALRGAKTLGEIIDKQCRDVLDVTGLHHLINEDGDGHWDVVWMRLFEMRDELASLKEATVWRERLRGDKWRDRAQEMEVSRDAAIERAEAAETALAAADPKPSTITTAEELDAAIVRSFEQGGNLVLLSAWRPWIVWEDDRGDLHVSSLPVEDDHERLALSDIHLPATVLYEPEAQS